MIDLIQQLIFRNEMLQEHIDGSNKLDRDTIKTIIGMNTADLVKVSEIHYSNSTELNKRIELCKAYNESLKVAINSKNVDEITWMQQVRLNLTLTEENKTLKIKLSRINSEKKINIENF